jgi:hypothetical protein
MHLTKLVPVFLVPALFSCAIPDGATVPAELTAMCIGTVSADAKNSAVNLSLADFIAALTNNGFVASWSGSATASVLTLRKDDKFAGKSTEFAFETEQRPYAGSIANCQPTLAVWVRAKLDGELLNAYASEHAALTIAQQALKARPAAALPPAAPAIEPDLEGPPAEPAPTTTTNEIIDPDAGERETYENAELVPTTPSEPYPLSNAM